MNCQNWQFVGSVEGFDILQSLTSSLKWIICGPKESLDVKTKREQSVDNSIRNISQIIIDSTKTKRQLNHISVTDSGRDFYNVIETPFTLGLAFHVHIGINVRYEAIGPQIAKAILGFHTITRCDQTGRFTGKSKSTWWKIFMKADSPIIDALCKLGVNEALPVLETLESMGKFVVKLYGGETYNINNLSDLRWYLFSKHQNDTEKLPPTMSALKYKIFRCHFVTLVLRRSHLPKQSLPNPVDYGWRNYDSNYD